MSPAIGWLAMRKAPPRQGYPSQRIHGKGELAYLNRAAESRHGERQVGVRPRFLVCSWQVKDQTHQSVKSRKITSGASMTEQPQAGSSFTHAALYCRKKRGCLHKRRARKRLTDRPRLSGLSIVLLAQSGGRLWGGVGCYQMIPGVLKIPSAYTYTQATSLKAHLGG